ncbi:unnamed protein product [Prorocentrum cordatum]|uniref:RING-type domain-containing protein n=1 Tax=Prorocentrum cordatum TaxID=2364126 RepID=A0ABN9SX71_9DINO|nr:unnamed protein product [Polarella glacialis]
MPSNDGSDDNACPTCWGDFSEAPCAALLCGHAYHQDCLQMAMNVGRDVELRTSLAGPVGSGAPLSPEPSPGVSGAAAAGNSLSHAPSQSPGAAPAPAAPAASAAAMSPAHGAQVSQTQASPVPLTANGSPVQHLQDDDWGLSFKGCAKAAGSAAVRDPMDDLAAELGKVTTERHLKSILCPADLFKGSCYDLTNAKAVYESVKFLLRTIHSGQETHLEICNDLGFSLRCLTTEPHRKAIHACALRNGWPQEGLLQGIAATTGWLENVKTRLALSEGDVHHRSPNVPGFMGGPPSTRKSSLHEFVTKWRVDSPDIEQDLREGRHTAGDGTVKGHRSAILNTGRSGATSAEASSVHECPQSENTKGINYISRVTMLKFVNCERDTSVTAQGSMSLDYYSYFHWVLGQIGPCEYILRPNDTGFAKRFSMLFVLSAENDASQICASSQEFLRKHCGWMGRFAEPREERHWPDGFASSMLSAATQATEDFLAETPDVDKNWAQKLLFSDADISRYANVAMRSAQFCGSLTSIPGGADQPARRCYNVHEMAVALHNWTRQIHAHHGFYISRATMAPADPPRQNRIHHPPSDAAGGPPSSSEGSGMTIRQFEASLTKEEWLKRAALKRPGCGVESTDKLRTAMKAGMKNKEITRASQALENAVIALRDANLVTFVEQSGDPLVSEGGAEPPAKKQKKGGWLVIHFKKMTWAAIQNNPQSREAAEQLRLSADNFDA